MHEPILWWAAAAALALVAGLLVYGLRQWRRSQRAAEARLQAEQTALLLAERELRQRAEEQRRQAGIEAARTEAAQREAEKQVAARAAEERLQRERLDQERVAQAQAAEHRLAEERRAAERLAEERLAEERLAQKRLAEERLAEERLDAERLARERLAEERLAAAREVELTERRLADERLDAARRAAEMAAAQVARASVAPTAPIAPVAPAAASVLAIPPAVPLPARLRRPEDTLVMVADDSKVVRVKTSRLLAQHRYRVVVAEDGDAAARLIESEVPLVLITDVEMPGMDGFALTRHVRAHPRAAHIPIIMITSADDRLQQAAADAGVTLVLGKPYAEEALIACIERAQAMAPADAAAPA